MILPVFRDCYYFHFIVILNSIWNINKNYTWGHLAKTFGATFYVFTVERHFINTNKFYTKIHFIFWTNLKLLLLGYCGIFNTSTHFLKWMRQKWNLMSIILVLHGDCMPSVRTDRSSWVREAEVPNCRLYPRNLLLMNLPIIKPISHLHVLLERKRSSLFTMIPSPRIFSQLDQTWESNRETWSVLSHLSFL